MREIRTLPEAEVLRRWAELYAAGKHKGYDAPNPAHYLGLDATWVEVEVPHDLYNAEWNTDDSALAPAQQKRAEQYAATPGALPPGMARYSGRSAKRGSGRLYVSDGNHRAYAAFLRGSPTARFYMPLKEWRAFEDVISRR